MPLQPAHHLGRHVAVACASPTLPGYAGRPAALVLLRRIAVVDGGWDRSQIEGYVRRRRTRAPWRRSSLEEMAQPSAAAQRR